MSTLKALTTPRISEELLDKMERAYAPRLITAASTMNEIMMEAGRQEVMTFLRAQVAAK